MIAWGSPPSFHISAKISFAADPLTFPLPMSRTSTASCSDPTREAPIWTAARFSAAVRSPITQFAISLGWPGSALTAAS